MMDRCPVCGADRLIQSVATARLRVQRCRVCGHRTAEHVARAQTSTDYHEQYDQGDFLTSLAATRRRQARVMIELIRRQLPAADRLVDFGAGRGWFLDACRDAGLQQLAGVDSSELAVRALTERRYGALALSSATTDYGTALRTLPFRPRVLTMLDVVEHFPPDRLNPMFSEILQALRPEIEAVVIKVPDANGILYRVARTLAAVGSSAAIEQLYQVGTDPPHWSYFTHGSMRRLLESAGFAVVLTQGDLDFEPESLSMRARALAGRPATAAVLGRLAAASARLTGWYDSTVFIAVARRIS